MPTGFVLTYLKKAYRQKFESLTTTKQKAVKKKVQSFLETELDKLR